ncbi:MAG TPA: hypothetical protein LFW20_01010 [Rickettsia endosymbiont of Omalisus fontisbellaquei]|nr:hypothetical protein [Rickettsia endosymbiont of Omalisus fontisbellaquei]
MKANDSIQKLEDKINACDRLLKRDPKNANAHYSKGGALAEIAKYTPDHTAKILYYNRASVCFDKAINLTNEGNSLYLIDRSKLHVDMGQTELAVADIKKVNVLDGVVGLYIKNTIRNIAKLETVQNTIKQLAAAGKIDFKLASSLQDFVKVVEGLVLTKDLHGEKLDEHDNKIDKLLDRMQQLENALKLSKHETGTIRDELDKLIADAGISGMITKAEIKKEFEALEKQSVELYAYCKTFYWTTLNLFSAYRNLNSNLIEGNIYTNETKGELLAAGVMKMVHYGNTVGSAVLIPFIGGTLSVLDTLIDDIYNAYKTNQFENRVNSINSIIRSKCTIESDLEIIIGKVALAVTNKKEKTILSQQIPTNSKIKNSTDWIQTKLDVIRDKILPSINLHDKDSQAVKLALQDVTLLIAYLCKNHEEILNSCESLDSQMKSIISCDSLNQLLIEAAGSTASAINIASTYGATTTSTSAVAKQDINKNKIDLTQSPNKQNLQSATKLTKTEQLANLKQIEDVMGKDTLKTIEDKAAQGKWDNRLSVGRDYVKKYQEAKYIEQLKSKIISPVKTEEVKICVLKHICKGINSSPQPQKDMECLTQFSKENQELMNKITTEYSALFEDDPSIAQLLGVQHYI